MTARTTDGEVLGTLFFEVITPAPDTPTPVPHGWHLRLWPQARLGDATVEAIPDAHDAQPQALMAALEAAGFMPLGTPVHHHLH